MNRLKLSSPGLHHVGRTDGEGWRKVLLLQGGAGVGSIGVRCMVYIQGEVNYLAPSNKPVRATAQHPTSQNVGG